MNKRNFLLGLSLLLYGSVLAANLTGCSSPEDSEEQKISTVSEEDIPSAEKEIFAMDTYMTVKAWGEQAEDAVAAAEQEISRLDSLWSVGNSGSEVSLINNNGTAEVSEDTGAILQTALELHEETEGAFDITIGPLMEAWGFTTQEYRIPEQSEIDRLLQYVDAGKIQYDQASGSVTLPEGVQIDFGGIAKGYTSDRIMDIFKEYDIISGLVSLGGNVEVYSTKTDGDLWRVGIQNPDTDNTVLGGDTTVGVVSLADKAVITSGGYERYFEQDGVTYHHILDPETGYPAKNGLISVTIVSDDGCLADGLSTALFVMGKEKALAFWQAHSDIFDAILIEEDGSITITGGLKDCYTSDLPYETADLQ